MTARAGTLTWDIDVGRADEAQRKIDELSRKLDAALNKSRSTGGDTPFKRVGEDADRARTQVQKYADQFSRLKAEHDLGQRSTNDYRTSLQTLQTQLQATARSTDTNTQEYRQLATTMGQTQRELDKLTREQERAEKSAERLTREQKKVADAALRDRIRSMTNEVAVLRNEWQETGEGTEQTKNRMRELQAEMATLRTELRQGEGGWEEYNREIRQLAVGGRSAQATIDGMEGKMSRLGLASQVNLGVTQALRSELGRFGPAGQVAGQGLGIVSSEMQKLMEIGPEKIFSTITGGVFRLGAAATLAGGALAVGLSVALFKATERAAEYAREMENATHRTGLTVEGLQELQHVARSTGVPLELLSTTMQRLQRRAADAHGGNKGLKQSFDALGVSLTDNEGKMRSTEDLLDQVADGLNGVENNAERLALAFKIFDTEGGRLLPLLTLGSEGIRELREEARQLGLVISGDTILSLSEFHAEIETIKQQLESARIEMTAAFLPVVRDVLVPLFSDHFVPWVQTAANNLSAFTDRLFDASEEGEVLRAKVASLIAPLLGAGDIALLAGTSVFGGLQTISAGIQLLANNVRIFIEQAQRDLIGWGAAEDYPDWMREQHDERFGEGTFEEMLGGRTNKATRDAVIADLKAENDAIMEAYLGDMGTWEQPLKDAWTRLQEGAYGEGIAEALRGMAPILREGGRQAGNELGDGLTSGASESTKRTIEQIEADLEEGFEQAARVAAIMGDGVESELWELQEQARLTDSAIAELLRHPDIGNQPTLLSGLLEDSERLDASIERVQRRMITIAGGVSGIAGIREGAPTDDPAEEARRRAAVAAWQEAQAAVDAYNASLADLELRLELGLVQPQDEANERLKATRAVIAALVPSWRTLTDEQKEYVRSARQDTLDLEAQIDAAARRVEEAQHRAQAAAEERRRIMAIQAGRFSGDGGARFTLQAVEQSEGAFESVSDALRKLSDVGVVLTMPMLELLDERFKETAESANSLDSSTRRAQEALSARFGGTGGIQFTIQAVERTEGAFTSVGDALRKFASAGVVVTGEMLEYLINRFEGASVEADRLAESMARLHQQHVAAAQALLSDRYSGMGGVRFTIQAVERTAGAFTSVSDAMRKLSEAGVVITGPMLEYLEERFETAADTVESLQWKLVALTSQGYDPTSEAVRRLVREINELQLRMALEELREKGVANLSEFARKVLEMNGVMASGTGEANKFTTALRGLNDPLATGLADIVDGISMVIAAGDDAETVVNGLTKALGGAVDVVDALASGDALAVLDNIADLAINLLKAQPGALGLVGGILDLGRSIFQAISDAFTGDSPVARALRESLRDSVQQAFSSGILAALQGDAKWRENLGENVKLAFLTGLINAFVQSAIIETLMQPILVKSSKLIAQGRYDEAMAIIAAELPAAIQTGIELAERFISGLPPGILPTVTPDPQPPGSPQAKNDPTGFFELPTAAITAIAAPDWARDLVNAGRMQLEAAAAFTAAVQLLATEGIAIRTQPGGAPPSGGNAAAARAV